MITKKNIVLGILMLILLATTIFASCGGKCMRPEKILSNFSKLIENGKLDNLSLTIYYIDPLVLTRAPLSVDDLINFSSVRKIVIDDIDVEKHIDLLKQITNTNLKPVKNKSRIDARLYYFFETEKQGKILDVAMWGDDASIFVNGIEVEENDIFYTVVKPFLSEDELKDLEGYLVKVD
ncbi:MAG TPA: hypothetical protein GXX36_08020 [Clostridiaceae bacterium]|nr:hypothetical protein [Clostridiaceae bacterium]